MFGNILSYVRAMATPLGVVKTASQPDTTTPDVTDNSEPTVPNWVTIWQLPDDAIVSIQFVAIRDKNRLWGVYNYLLQNEDAVFAEYFLNMRQAGFSDMTHLTELSMTVSDWLLFQSQNDGTGLLTGKSFSDFQQLLRHLYHS